MRLVKSISRDTSIIVRWAYVTSAIAIAGLMNYVFMLFASRGMELGQFNDLVFLFSIPTTLAMVISPIGATILSSKEIDGEENTGIFLRVLLRKAFLLISASILAFFTVFTLLGKVTLTVLIVAMLWLPILFFMSFGTSLLQLQKRFIFFAAFPVLAASLKLLVLYMAFQLNFGALEIAVCIQLCVGTLAVIQFTISGGLKKRYVNFDNRHFSSIVIALFIVSVLLSGEVFAARLLLSYEEIYVISLGLILGKLTYIFSAPLIELILADLYSGAFLEAKKVLVVTTLKRILIVSSIAALAALILRLPLYKFINVDRNFISVQVTLLLLLNGLLGAIVQLMTHYVIAIKRRFLTKTILIMLSSGSITFPLAGHNVRGVLMSLALVLVSVLAVMSFPDLFKSNKSSKLL